MCIYARRTCDCLRVSSVAETRVELPTQDLELVAVVHALKIWRHYIMGTRCQVYTGYKSLKYIFTQKDLNLRQCRWLELIKD
jgi:hypothetical protein